MQEIVADAYSAKKGKAKARHLVAEAVLAKKVVRDRFVTQVVNKVESSSGVRLTKPLIVLLEDSVDALSMRRNRSREEYSRLIEGVERYSEKFHYIVYDGVGKEVDERVDDILSLWLGV